jgi:hypothetical protein
MIKEILCEHPEYRLLDCQDCADNEVACTEIVCVECGETRFTVD